MRTRDRITLAVSTLVLIGTTVAIALLSQHFTVATTDIDRPVGLLLATFAVSGAAYLAALTSAIKLSDSRRSWAFVVGVAIVLRALLITTTPILEIDLYRYLWDGNVAEAGISPYRYAPQEVRVARSLGTDDPLLQKLVGKCEAAPAIGSILNVVHYGELRTPYPAVSQAVFWFSATITADNAAEHLHVTVIKSLLTLFDLGSLLLLIGLLRQAGLSIGWAIAYGWCPLILKEFANSGHLDAIAVFFTLVTVRLAVSAAQSKSPSRWLMTAGALALAVAAKIYPIVLAPLLAVRAWQTTGWRTTLASIAMFAASTALLFQPMLRGVSGEPTTAGLLTSTQNNDGLRAFVQRWEINDLLFAVLVENIKDDSARRTETDREQIYPWFSFVPVSWRAALLNRSRSLIDRNDDQAYLVTRILVGCLYCVIALWLVWCCVRDSSGEQWLRSVFLAIAWLWLLAPTQNPWYWAWALPFVPFVRSRAWLLLGVLPLMYYGRFWFEYHQPIWVFLGESYQGVDIFDYLIVWLEYLPFWTVLAVSCVVAYRQARHSTARRDSDNCDVDLSKLADIDLRSVSVIIPAHNEEESIGHVLDDLPEVREVIVVNNGSTDATASVAAAHGASVVDDARLGYGQACLTGIEHIANQVEQGEAVPKVVAFVDGDYSDYPEQLPRLVAPILAGDAQFVIGSRSLGERERGSMTPPQVFGNWLACTLMHWLWNVRYSDLGPFRAIDYDALCDLGMRDTNFGWTVEMQIKAAQANLSIVEVPVPYRRRVGVSKISGTVSGTIKAGYKILYTIFRYRLSS